MKCSSKGFTLVELLVVIGILGVLMSSLFPAITGAVRSSNMTACGMNGSKLYTAINGREMSRSANGLGSIYPFTTAQNDASGSGQKDISEESYSNCKDYFNDLFDMDNVGSSSQKPYIEVDMKVLWGFGVNPPANGKKLEEKNILWCIGANMPDSAPDFVPLLVTRNAKLSDFLRKYSGSGGGTLINIGSQNGAEYDTPFSSKGFVFITRGGATQKIDSARDATYSALYSQQFDLSVNGDSDVPDFVYLSPKGTINTKSN